MCGIIGIVKNQNLALAPSVLIKARDAVAHRGPDDARAILLKYKGDSWEVTNGESTNWQIGLAFRRLSILDLSPAGHQPMIYRNRYWIIYNGEIYNFLELRDELIKLGYDFHSNSDTEVILASYAEWGTSCFKRFRGMWGMVIFDTFRNEVIVCRDRMGIKPLYIWQNAELIAVFSEIKQAIGLPGFQPRLCQKVASEFLLTGYEDQYLTFFEDVKPVPAGTWIRINIDNLTQSVPVSYWSPEHIRVSIRDQSEASHMFAEKIQESIKLHLRSDVPVGFALSGGLDSSSIAILANQLQSSEQVTHTFSAVFPKDKIDETEFITAVLDIIQTKSHFVTPHSDQFLLDLKEFLWTQDEPVSSLSIYASFCVARLARQAGIPVILSGQGGDEILSGYWQTYFMYLRSLAKQGKVFELARHLSGALLDHGNPDLLRQVPVMLRRYRARRNPHRHFCLRLDGSLDRIDFIQEIMNLNEQEKRIYEIRHMFLPRLLKWEDRNSMAFSVEGRYPFLDHELIELCLSFNGDILYHAGWTKWPLRIGLKDVLPPKVQYRRSKFGFEVPQDQWLCGPLRPKFEKWLLEDRPVWQFIEPQEVKDLARYTWQLNGRQDEPGQTLLRLFIFDQWLEVFQVKL